MKRYIVNDKEVEYLHIQEDRDGTIRVEYEEKFNIVTAHMGAIMERLRDNRLDGVLVFKRLEYDVICVVVKSEAQIVGTLHALGIPHACYDVLYDDLTIVIDVPLLERALLVENVVGSEEAIV